MSNLTALSGKNNVSIQPQIEAALVRASKATGIDFKYLVDTALRESNLKTEAKSKASSATGLFQFIDETWLSTLKEFGPKFGLKKYADAIERSASGRHKVSSPALHKAILALRTNPEVSALMAGAYAGKSATHLKELLGRAPRQGELYITHFLGIKGGGELITAASQKPKVSAASMFPQAAKSNPSIFYNKRGQPRTVRQVYYGLVSKHSNDIASFKTQKAQLVRIPGQPLKLNDGLLKNLDRPMPVENALIANARYVRSNLQARAISTRPTPVQSQPADVYRPTPWPVKPLQEQGQKVQYPAAGPGSLGYQNVETTTSRIANKNGSLVSAVQRPFAAFSKVAAVLKSHVEQTRPQAPLKPTILDTPAETGDTTGGWLPVNTEPAQPVKFGQLFVDAGATFFTMRGKKN